MQILIASLAKVGAYMQQVLSSQELYLHLNNFRETLQKFDYSDLENVTFFNLESVYTYIENIENNPFKRQYNALQQTLDNLQPYLPFLSSQRARDFLIQVASATDDEDITHLKIEYTKKLRMDFINAARMITSEKDWETIVNICEEIRSRKEEVYLN